MIGEKNETNEKNVLLSLSGGLDSTVLLASLLRDGYNVQLATFVYASKHNVYERIAAHNVATHYKLQTYVVNALSLFQWSKSALLINEQPIPEGHYEEESMKATVVPGRNLIFASVLASIAESQNISNIAFAAHSGDHHIYPDCRPDFFTNLFNTIHLSTDGKVKVLAPFLYKNKTEIVKIGEAAGVPFNLTRTCYKEQLVACGKCGSCVERLEAFKNAALTDPIEYERDVKRKETGLHEN